MSDPVEDFLAAASTDPLPLFANWLEDAAGVERDARAAVLATVDPAGRPSSRSITIHEVTGDGVLLFMNLHSRKGADLAADPRCALTVYWPTLFRQVNVSGVMESAPARTSDRLWAERGSPRQAVSTGSVQGRGLDDLGSLRSRVAAAGNSPVPRPEHHTALVLRPSTVELWLGSQDLVHGRLHYERDGADWRHVALQP